MEMGILDYCGYAAMGMCVVFCALIFLMIVIKIMGSFGDGEGGGKSHKPAKNADEKAALSGAGTGDGRAALAAAGAASAAGTTAASISAAGAPVGNLAPGTAGELKLYDTDPRDAAMVMAIVADELGKPLNELRFISIREVKK